MIHIFSHKLFNFHKSRKKENHSFQIKSNPNRADLDGNTRSYLLQIAKNVNGS